MSTEHSPDHGNGNGNGNGSDDGELYGYMAEYDTPGELVEAARKVRDAGYTDFDCYSPFPVHGIDPAMGIKRTILPLIIFGGGFTGALSGLLLQWYCNAHAWTWNIYVLRLRQRRRIASRAAHTGRPQYKQERGYRR